MKKIITSLIIIILLFSIICIIPNRAMAAGTADMNDGGGGGITAIPNTNRYDPRNKTTEDDAELLSKANKIIGWVESIGIMVSVLVLSALGLKYMVGSVEEKATYKKSMQPYIIGCVLTFGIMTILKMISALAGLIK